MIVRVRQGDGGKVIGSHGWMFPQGRASFLRATAYRVTASCLQSWLCPGQRIVGAERAMDESPCDFLRDRLNCVRAAKIRSLAGSQGWSVEPGTPNCQHIGARGLEVYREIGGWIIG